MSYAGLGRLEVRGTGKGSDIHSHGQYDALAIYNREMLFASVIADQHNLKAMRAVINSMGIIPAEWVASGLTVRKPGQHQPYNPGRCSVSEEGYDVYRVSLGFGQHHAFFVCRNPSFMLVASDEALWRELKSDRFTTPVLRSWLPWIRGQMSTLGLIDECAVCPHEDSKAKESMPLLDGHEDRPRPAAPVLRPAVISASTEDIDSLVLRGLRGKQLFIDRTPDSGGISDV